MIHVEPSTRTADALYDAEKVLNILSDMVMSESPPSDRTLKVVATSLFELHTHMSRTVPFIDSWYRPRYEEIMELVIEGVDTMLLQLRINEGGRIPQSHAVH